VLCIARSSSAPAPVLSLERCVGELVATAAAVLAEGLREFAHRGLTIRTKARGGDLICELFRLRQMMVGAWDFDGIAFREGVAVLRQHCGDEISDATIAELVGAVIDIVRKVSSSSNRGRQATLACCSSSYLHCRSAITCGTLSIRAFATSRVA
jgi:hypothetical protein